MHTEGWLCEIRTEQQRVLGYTWSAYAWLCVHVLESGRRVIAGHYPYVTAVFHVISAVRVTLAADDACQVEEVSSRVLCLHIPAL